MSFIEPFMARPIGVRAVATMTASGTTGSSGEVDGGRSIVCRVLTPGTVRCLTPWSP
jgi:hypothetical protein